MRISLRELMLVVTVAAVGLAGLKFASLGMLPIVGAMAGLLMVAFLVRAIKCCGAQQAFAVGFVLCGLVGLTAFSGKFGAVLSLDWLHDAIATQEWVKSSTGQPNGEFFTRRATATRRDFRAAGYCLEMLLMGYVGGRIARFAIARRTTRGGLIRGNS